MVVGLVVYSPPLLLCSTIKVSRLHLGAVILVAARVVPTPASAHREGTDLAWRSPRSARMGRIPGGETEAGRVRPSAGQAGNGARGEGVGWL